jgi:hypothetical protein
VPVRIWLIFSYLSNFEEERFRRDELKGKLSRGEIFE